MCGIENPKIRLSVLNKLTLFFELIINKKEIKNRLEPIFIKLAKPIDNPVKMFRDFKLEFLLKIWPKAKNKITRYSE